MTVVKTPDDLYNELNDEFTFDFDPCPLNPDFDGLNIDWSDSNYVNPPYNNIARWLKKGIRERNKGNTSVFLIPARVNRRYWFDLVWPEASEVRFIHGCIKFDGYTGGSPFPVAIVVFEPNKKAKYEINRSKCYPTVTY